MYKLNNTQIEIKNLLDIKHTKNFILELFKLSGEHKEINMCLQGLRDTTISGISGDHSSTPYMFYNVNDFIDDTKRKEILRRSIIQNLSGFGIHIAINNFRQEGDKYLRRKEYVNEIRAFVVDIDTFISDEIIDELINAFKPSLVIYSSSKEEKHKIHMYWLVDNRFEDNPKLLEKYELIGSGLNYRIQDYLNNLIQTGQHSKDYPNGILVDKNISLSKTIRLPGFVHLKDLDNMHTVQMAYINKEENYVCDSNINTWLKEIWKISKKHLAQNVTQTGLIQVKDSGADIGKAIEEGGRNNFLAQYAWTLITNRGFSKLEALGTCIVYNQQFCKPPLAMTEVKQVVESAWSKYLNSLSDSAKKKADPVCGVSCIQQFQKELESVDKGKASLNTVKASEVVKGIEYDYSKREQFVDVLSDKSILYRLHQRYGNVVKGCNSFDSEIGIRVYNRYKGLWEINKGQLDTWLNQVIVDMPREKVVQLQFKKVVKTDETEEGDKRKKKTKEIVDYQALNKYIIGKRSAGAGSALHKAVVRMEDFQAEITDFDKHLHLLNLPWGVLDLENKQLYKPAPHYMITKCMGLPSKVDAGAIKVKNHILQDWLRYRFLDTKESWEKGGDWCKFVYEVSDYDIYLARFLQVIAGYSLHGSLDAQLIFHFFGGGANGKSVFLETLLCLFGSYGASVSNAMFLEARRNESSNETARLAERANMVGVRFTLGQEIPQKAYLAESVIKDITTGAPIQAKYYYKPPFTFNPQFTSFLHGNHMPNIKGTDVGIWRRYVQVPFDVDFRNNINPLLASILRSPENRIQIFHWLLAGLDIYQKEGIVFPGRVSRAKESIKLEMNPLDSFITECVFPTSDSLKMLTSDKLFSMYLTYCEENEVDSVDIRLFGRILKQRNIKKIRVSGKINKYGLLPTTQGIELLKRVEAEKGNSAIDEVEREFKGLIN